MRRTGCLIILVAILIGCDKSQTSKSSQNDSSSQTASSTEDRSKSSAENSSKASVSEVSKLTPTKEQVMGAIREYRKSLFGESNLEFQFVSEPLKSLNPDFDHVYRVSYTAKDRSGGKDTRTNWYAMIRMTDKGISIGSGIDPYNIKLPIREAEKDWLEKNNLPLPEEKHEAP